jgi:hypothetical protein
MLSKKRLLGAVVGAVMVGTRIGREQLGKIVGLVKQRLGGGGSDPFAVAPTDRDVPLDVSAADLPPEQRQAFAAEHPPTPGTVAVAVGAPNAPDLEVIAGDHDAEHRPES